MKNYILGYGSLINVKSLSKTIKREVSTKEIIPVKLHSFRRKWNLKERIYSSELNADVDAIFLNLEKNNQSWINAVIFEVTNSELEYLNYRERKYSHLDVSKQVELYSGNFLDDGSITAYVAEDLMNLQNETSADLYIMENYVKIVDQGCMDLGHDFYADYKQTTDKINFKTLKGDYRFV